MKQKNVMELAIIMDGEVPIPHQVPGALVIPIISAEELYERSSSEEDELKGFITGINQLEEMGIPLSTKTRDRLKALKEDPENTLLPEWLYYIRIIDDENSKYLQSLEEMIVKEIRQYALSPGGSDWEYYAELIELYEQIIEAFQDGLRLYRFYKTIWDILVEIAPDPVFDEVNLQKFEFEQGSLKAILDSEIESFDTNKRVFIRALDRFLEIFSPLSDEQEEKNLLKIKALLTKGS